MTHCKTLLSMPEIEPQQHPTLGLQSPVSIIEDHLPGPAEHLKGDVHRAMQLTIVTSGRTLVQFKEFSKICDPGELWWTDRFEPHAYRPLEENNSLVTINIAPESLEKSNFFPADLRQLFAVPPVSRYQPTTGKSRKTIRRLARRWLRLYTGSQPYSREQIYLELQMFLLKILRFQQQYAPFSPTTHPDYERIVPALHAIRTSTGKMPSLPEGAALCNLSQSRFSFLFRQTLGVSYGKYALHERLSRAARDVADGRMTLEDIASKWGFCDAGSFCRAFKQLYHCRPGQFRHG